MKFKLWNIGYALSIWAVQLVLGIAFYFAAGMLTLALGFGFGLEWYGATIIFILLMLAFHVLTAMFYGRKFTRPESAFWRQFPFAVPVIIFFLIELNRGIAVADVDFM
ncbi:MAG: hypothetical protein FWE06_01560 [Oscillospiraceae bacterium]|nr:hypothetical protein [Oscillospiraceae bacterium]